MGTVDPRRLYAWLGEQAKNAAAEQDEAAVNLDVSAGPAYMAEAFIQVREHMRQVDPSLPFVPAVDNDIML